MNQEPHSPTLLDDNYDEEVVRLYPSGSVSSFSEMLDNNLQMDTMDSDQISPISGGALSDDDEALHSSNNLNDLNPVLNDLNPDLNDLNPVLNDLNDFNDLNELNLDLNLDLNDLNSSSSSCTSDSSDASSDHSRMDYADHQNIVQGNLSELIDSLIDTLVSENTEIANIVDMMRAKLSREEYVKWLSLTYMLASVHPYRKEARISPIFPGTNTFVRAIRMVLGPRGMVHGWAGNLPDMEREIQINENINCVWPNRWAPNSDSDGNSSFQSDSSGQQCFTAESDAWCNGPRGVADGRPPVSGFTTFSETSSCLSEDSMPVSRLDIYPVKGRRNPEQARLLKRLDNYLRQSKHERIHRREIRRARRIERSRHDQQRRLMDPAYDLEATRAIILAAERMKRERLALDKKAAKEKMAQSNMRKEYRESRRDHFKPQAPQKERSPSPPPMCQPYCPVFRMRTKIGIQICETWTRLYGRFIETAAEPMSFHCWVTPVRWVKQDGPNCGLAVLSMAARPVLTCEAPLYGSTNAATDAVSGAEDITINLAAVQNAQLQSRSKNICQFNYLVPSLMDYHDVAIDAGYSNHGEMFSARVMVQLANYFRPGQHTIDLVREDLMTPQPPTTLPITPQGPTKKSSKKTVNADCQEEKTKSGKSLLFSEIPSTSVPVTSFKGILNDPNKPKVKVLKDIKVTHIKEYVSDDRDSYSPYQWKLESGRPLPAYMYTPIKLVQRLIRGDLIAVCFDCDRNMLPSSRNKGATAHWALLCGVIIAKKIGDVEMPKYRYDKKTKNVLQEDLDRDVDKIWMIGRHGKNHGQYVVWSFRELLESNRQLSTPAPKIMNTIPPEVKRLWYNDERDLKPLPMDETNLQDQRNSVVTSDNCGDQNLLLAESQSPASPPSPDRRNNLPPQPKTKTMPYILSKPPTPSQLPLLRQPSSDDQRRPFVLPDGPRLDLCLANQYIGFKPLHEPNSISFFDHPHSTHPLNPILFEFCFTVKKKS